MTGRRFASRDLSDELRTDWKLKKTQNLSSLGFRQVAPCGPPVPNPSTTSGNPSQYGWFSGFGKAHRRWNSWLVREKARATPTDHLLSIGARALALGNDVATFCHRDSNDGFNRRLGLTRPGGLALNPRKRHATHRGGMSRPRGVDRADRAVPIFRRTREAQNPSRRFQQSDLVPSPQFVRAIMKVRGASD